MRGTGKRKGFTLYEQVAIWISACILAGWTVTHLPIGEKEKFEIIPDSVLTVSTALGLVLLSYGIWAVWRALADRSPSVGAGAFALPFVGLLVWTAPILVEVWFR